MSRIRRCPFVVTEAVSPTSKTTYVCEMPTRHPSGLCHWHREKGAPKPSQVPHLAPVGGRKP